MSVKDRVFEILENQLFVKKEDISMDSSLINDLGADSLDKVEVVMCLEEEFEIEIPDIDSDKFSYVKDVVEYVEGKVGK